MGNGVGMLFNQTKRLINYRSMRNRSISYNYLWFVTLLLSGLVACNGPEKKAYHSFVHAAKQSIDPVHLRAESSALLVKYADPGGEAVPVAELPDELKRIQGGAPIDARVVYFSQSSNEPTLMIIWGNGFAHWGIWVGNARLEKRQIDDYAIEKWSAGVVFFLQKR